MNYKKVIKKKQKCKMSRTSLEKVKEKLIKNLHLHKKLLKSAIYFSKINQINIFIVKVFLLMLK